jgi:hypothetical protein
MSSNTTEWGSNDYSNLITITASAIASVLLVVFKSRCKKISICYGLLSCDRVVQSESEDDEEEQKKLTKTKSKSTKEASPEPEDLY